MTSILKDSMLVNHFVDPDGRIEMFTADSAGNNQNIPNGKKNNQYSKLTVTPEYYNIFGRNKKDILFTSVMVKREHFQYKDFYIYFGHKLTPMGQY